MNLPSVTVLIPCYNHECYIEECVNSVLNQDYENLTIIVTDDCSTDNSSGILFEKYQRYPQIKLIFNETNKGLHLSMKNMLEIADGEYIAQFSGDDYWCDKSKITKQINWFQTNKNASICFSGVNKLDRFGKFESTFYKFEDIENEKNIFKKIYFLGESSSSFLIRKEYISNDPFPTQLEVYADWYYLCEVGLRGKVGGIKDCTTIYRKHENSLSSLNFNTMFYEHLEVCFLLKNNLNENLINDLYDMIDYLFEKKYESFVFENEKKVQWLTNERVRLSAHIEEISKYKIFRIINFLNEKFK